MQVFLQIIIIGPKYYQQSIIQNFFQKYFHINICYYEVICKDGFSILIFNKTDPFDKDSFPTIFLYNRALNYIIHRINFYFFEKIKFYS